MLHRRRALQGFAAAAISLPNVARAQAKAEIAISRQPGILYLALHVIEKERLIEKHAERLGIKGATVKWLSFANGGAQQDALLAGGVDVVNTGTGQLLLLWDRTRGGVKGIAASCAPPLTFVTRDPRIQSLKDLGQSDKIAVPTVKISTQALLLQIAATDMFGVEQWNHFDPLTVQLGHPDAFVAMKNPVHEVRNHFGAPPFDFYELKEIQGARKITDSTSIIGGRLTQGQFFTTTRFAESNPKFVEAVAAAARDAKAAIESDLPRAVEAYRELNNDKTPTEILVELLSRPGFADWNLYPQGTMKIAMHLHRIGTLKTRPASWKDYYLPYAHDTGAGS